MSSHRFGVAAVALLGMMAASATPPPRPVLRHPAAPVGSAPLMAFGGRSAEQLAGGIGGKLDAALADLTRHAYRARPDRALEDLHSLSPAARFMQHSPGAEPLVAVDAVTRGDPQLLKNALVSLGLEHPAVFRNDVGGWLPVSAIDAAAARAELVSMRAALWHTRAVVATQGDFAQGSRTIRTEWPALTGSGITVGAMSDSYNCYSVYATNGLAQPLYAPNGITTDAQQDVASGALPSGVNVLAEAGHGTTQGACLDYNAQGGPAYFLPYADEGRAMLQIVHAVAPGANLAFYTAVESEADFANGIEALAAAGAKIVVDDVGYYDEPFFQDGIVAQAIDKVEGQGVAYFSAAGNDGELAYDNTAPSFATASTTPPGEMLLTVGMTGTTPATGLPVSVPSLLPGDFIVVVLEWDQPYVTGAPNSGGASSQIDLCVVGATGLTLLNNNAQAVTSCTGPNATGVDPVQILVLANPATAAGSSAQMTVTLTVGLVNGSPAPGRIKLAVQDNGAGAAIDARFATNSATLQGHPGAAGAAAVGAAFFTGTVPCGAAQTALDLYSSEGGAPILFDASGNRLATAVVRQKPDFVGPDGVNTTFFGFFGAADISSVAQCANNKSFPNYFGTSAAAPHAAAAAALMLQSNPALTPAQIYTAMQNSAAPMGGGATPNYNSGHGFIQASAALALLPPAAPTLAIAPTTITAGSSATLTWNSVNTTGCSATGSWSGTQATSGSQMVTPTTTGSQMYTLACGNGAGTSAATSVNLMVQAAPPSSGGKGGGGALGEWTLLALAGLGLGRRSRAARARRAA